MAAHTYTFHLKQNIKWHDGTPFTADDVIFTYNQLVKSDAVSDSLKANYEDITSVTAPDANTVVFTLSQNDNGMLEYFTIGILPKHIYEGQDLLQQSITRNLLEQENINLLHGTQGQIQFH